MSELNLNHKHIADIIQDEVGYFNGWKVNEDAERKSCEMASKNIIKYITRKLNTRSAVDKEKLLEWIDKYQLSLHGNGMRSNGLSHLYQAINSGQLDP